MKKYKIKPTLTGGISKEPQKKSYEPKKTKEKEVVNSGPDALDTIIMNSQKNFELTNEINKQSDSVVSTKVDHTVKKITKMEGEIKQLKQLIQERIRELKKEQKETLEK